MNDTDQLLHEKIHEHMMSIPPDKIFSRRVDLFDQLEKKIGLGVRGVVLDIGCGSGYASIWLAKNKPVTRVYAQEASTLAVRTLLPRNIAYHQVADLVEPMEGSFDAIPFKSSLDFVISFGALHHSPCLFSTMQSVSKALKDGGHLIAQEPVMPNTTSNQAYIDKYNVIENSFGMKIRNGDRVDNFFREAEYITAASFAGLDLVFYEEFSSNPGVAEKIGKWKALLNPRRMAGALKRKLMQRGHAPKMAGNENEMKAHTANVMRKVFVFRKRETEYIPHLWRGLDGIRIQIGRNGI